MLRDIIGFFVDSAGRHAEDVSHTEDVRHTKHTTRATLGVLPAYTFTRSGESVRAKHLATMRVQASTKSRSTAGLNVAMK